MYRLLVVLQWLGLLIATGLAVCNIETIVVSGPILSLTGFGIAAASFRSYRVAGFYVGLSAPTVAVCCFSIICGLEWSPSDAQWPIASLLVLYCLISLSPSVYALVERNGPAGRRHGRFQFSIAAMLGAMVVAAVLCSSIRIGNPQAIAVGAIVAYFIVALYIVRRFHAQAFQLQDTAGEEG